MLPSVWPGDLLVIHRASLAELDLGDLALYASNEGFVIHRVVGKTADCMITRGDSFDWHDEPVSRERVLGKVVTVERGGFRLAPPPGTGSAHRILRFLIRRCSPLRSAAMRLSGLRHGLRRARKRERVVA